MGHCLAAHPFEQRERIERRRDRMVLASYECLVREDMLPRHRASTTGKIDIARAHPSGKDRRSDVVITEHVLIVNLPAVRLLGKVPAKMLFLLNFPTVGP